MRVPIFHAARFRDGGGAGTQILANTVVLLDPADPENAQVADDTSLGTTALQDTSGNNNDTTFVGSATAQSDPNDLRWRDGSVGGANSQPYWQRLAAAAGHLQHQLPNGMMSGVVESELWMVVIAENDPGDQTGPFHFGSDRGTSTGRTIYPLNPTGNEHDLYLNFGATAREFIDDTPIRSAGFGDGAFASWRILRMKLTGTSGAGNLTITTFLDGVQLQSTAGFTSGWHADPLFWAGINYNASGVTSFYGGVGYFQVFSAALSDEDAAEHLAYLGDRFGIAIP